jgi:hypothetical protein
MTAGYQHFKEYTASTFRVEQLSIVKSAPRHFSKLQFPMHKNMPYNIPEDHNLSINLQEPQSHCTKIFHF